MAVTSRRNAQGFPAGIPAGRIRCSDHDEAHHAAAHPFDRAPLPAGALTQLTYRGRTEPAHQRCRGLRRHCSLHPDN